MKRFNHDAETQEEIKNYIKNRAIQLLGQGVVLKKYEEKDFGAVATWEYRNENWVSVYIKPSCRGQGVYLEFVKDNDLKIITVSDCLVENFLKSKKIPHLVLNHFIETSEYKMISSYYGNKKAKRSDVYLMNHIDEGLAVLDWIGAEESVKKAYCLHPILQSDADIITNLEMDLSKVSPKSLILAMEYRHVANSYLSFRSISTIKEINLGPFKEIEQMLIADKIQNYKDFILYHKDTHPRSLELTIYFENWLEKLNIKDMFKEYNNKLQINDNIIFSA